MNTSLNAHRQRLVMEYSECLCILVVPLTHLDLSGGCLTGCSDLLRCVCEAVNLHTLDISNNALTHTDFRLLLARYRMHRLGFKMLECVNMSGNTVTLKVLKCFLNMPRLCHLKVSRASTLTEKCPIFVRDWNACTEEHNFVELDFREHNIETHNIFVNSNVPGWMFTDCI
ncbi:hypothetical protein Pmani_020353 [Petrolisthes manimaculis]|uniref:Uncharacterized protein n=1 Tax=Petrolisthes manimaculis TaxID=1843537 RepID=A0AAE1PFU9_9EUCA|nr:hypothetical protein Pmani_020353 [Petrolisthes manimaculis]